MRTIIELTDDQIEALRAICKRKGISRAEAIRQAVQKMAEEENAEQLAMEDALNEAFGSWKHLEIDTDTYLDELRSEWER